MPFAASPFELGRPIAPRPRAGDRLVVVDHQSRRAFDLRLGRTLGEGGMATVFAASDGETEHAVKILRRDLAQDPQLRTRFFLEKRFADRVSHPATVAVHAAGETPDGDLALVMELAAGEDLENVRRRLGGKLPLAGALRVAEEVLSFLVACHAQGIFHRDIKTANVLWTDERAVRVVDFGIATFRGDDPLSLERTLGTPAFMSPEQAAGRTVDARSDLFSVGAVLFTLLTGARLHRGRSHPEALFAAATTQAPSVGSLCDALPDDVVALVDRALAFDPAARWPDAMSMHNAVAHLRRREEARASLPPDPSEIDDGLVEGSGPSSVFLRTRAADARGTLDETPLPNLLVHILARRLDGLLFVVDESGAREKVEFAAGAPIRCGRSATDDPVVGPLARIAQMPSSSTYSFYIEETDPPRGALPAGDPLDAILTSTRRFWQRDDGRAHVRSVLARLDDRPLELHPAATPARFGMSPRGRAFLDAAIGYEMSLPRIVDEWIDRGIYSSALVEPVVYALGITRHLDIGLPSTWPVGVPRR
jgi:serine/threonine-protein kinase